MNFLNRVKLLWLLCVVTAVAIFALPAAADSVIKIWSRSVKVHVPPGYDPSIPIPVIMLLHGFEQTGAYMQTMMDLEGIADELGFLALQPDGHICNGSIIWDATTACCNFECSDTNDVGYLIRVLDELAMQYNVDPLRVHVMGFSNGGFMSYRMACEHANRIGSFASISGAMFLNASDCSPSQPVHQLEIHGELDLVIDYAGDELHGNAFPGALTSTQMWASYNGCSSTPDLSPANLDMVSHISGSETSVLRYAEGCESGGSAELWTMAGTVHNPFTVATAEFTRNIVDHLLAHPKPSGCGNSGEVIGEVCPIAAIVPATQVPGLAGEWRALVALFIAAIMGFGFARRGVGH